MNENKPVQYAKLLKTAEFLDTQVPRRRFSMHTWRKETECGTVACIAGWIPTIFPRSSFKHFTAERLGGGYGVRYRNVDGEHRGFNAVAAFFGISGIEASELCDPLGDARRERGGPYRIHTPKQAAAYIRKFVRRKQKENCDGEDPQVPSC